MTDQWLQEFVAGLYASVIASHEAAESARKTVESTTAMLDEIARLRGEG